MSSIFDPIKIGSMELKNRTFMAPVSLGYGTQEGVPSAVEKAYWEARAKGGVGCIITDATSVDPNTPYLGNTLCFRNETSIAKHKELTDLVHSYGAKIIPQITHPGPESISSFYGVIPISSSGYLNSMHQVTRALAIEEIPGIVAMYANASYQAMQAGYDGIELHAAHGYMLLGSFLSPLRNKRTDAYGGSLMNRARLLIEVVDAIKAKCGRAFPIILRMSGDEKVPGGNTVEDMMELVPVLIEHGIDAFEISGGVQYEVPNKIMPSHGEPVASNLEEARKIKSVSTVPVILVGKINRPAIAKKLLADEEVDAVVLGRALIADPEFVNKIEQGREEEIAPCAGCLVGCVGEQSKRRPGSCVINPFVGREAELTVTPLKEPKKVMVIGGGIGGLAAAKTAAMRGAKVTLYEKEKELGGQINLAKLPPFKEALQDWISYLERECRHQEVTIVCGHTVTKEEILSSDADAVILANGSVPVAPSEGEHVCTAHQVLQGEVRIPSGKVLIVGGGMTGMETAEFIDAHKEGSLSLTIIEMSSMLGAGVGPANLVLLMKRLREAGAVMLPDTKLIKLEKEDAVVETKGETKTLSGFTHVVYAVGSKPDDSLYEAVKDCGKEIFVIGDAKAAGQALEAVKDGNIAALSL